MQTIVPHATDGFLELLAHRALKSAAVVVARRGKAPPLASPPCGGARFPTLAAIGASPSGAGLGVLDDYKRVAVHHRAVVTGAKLGGEVAGTTAEKRW
jgi:hypothetical protein